MSTLKGANVTKFDAGGSGDNYIEDGYIKTVEKVWIDNYHPTTVIGSNDTIAIAHIPKNKKITDITVYLPVMGGAADSLATLHVGSASTMLATISTNYLGALKQVDMTPGTTTFNIGTACTMKLTPDKFGTVTDKDVTIYLRLFQANLLPLVLTSTTIRTIVRYT